MKRERKYIGDLTMIEIPAVENDHPLVVNEDKIAFCLVRSLAPEYMPCELSH
jgi:hypothetical protein